MGNITIGYAPQSDEHDRDEYASISDRQGNKLTFTQFDRFIYVSADLKGELTPLNFEIPESLAKAFYKHLGKLIQSQEDFQK